MSEILFYHLTEAPLGRVLPSLIERSLARGWNVAVQCPSEAERAELDALLWGVAEASFLPHGMDTEAFAPQQPVLLSLKDANQNQAYVCFCVAGACAENPQNFSRVCLVFDGHNPAQLQTARAAWKKWQAEEKNGEKCHRLVYWRQTPQGKWEQKG